MSGSGDLFRNLSQEVDVEDVSKNLHKKITPENPVGFLGSDLFPEVGDTVIANATATWHRCKNYKLPHREVPPSYKNASTIPINVLGEPLFFELMEPSKVLAIRGDRVEVRNQKTGRTSVFLLADVKVLERSTDGE